MTHDQSSHDRLLEEAARPDISTLASTVLSLLSDKGDEACRAVRASGVRRLVDDCLSEEGYDAEQLLGDLRRNRLHPDQIVDIYIPEAARALGQMWIDDDISFAKVTIATARLQGLLTLLAVPWCTRSCEPEDQISLLMNLQIGDCHTLGPHVAVAQLRRMGASVRVLFGADSDTLVRMLSEERYDLVMFSCSSKDALVTISQIVTRIRSAVSDVPPVALGGLVVDLVDHLRDRTGVDLVTNDARVAFKLCEKKRPRIKTVAK